MNDGVNLLLADPAGDQLCVLRAEIEDEDRLRGLHFRILPERKTAAGEPEPAAGLKKRAGQECYCATTAREAGSNPDDDAHPRM